MRPLHFLWNVLAPWRRRRRYYFLRVVAVLRDLHRDPARPSAPLDATDQAKIRLAFGVDPLAFDDLMQGVANPPRYVETLARAAYKLPPPPFVLLYGPVITVAGIILITFGLSYLLLR